jgi:CBS domain-containing protein
LGLRASLWKDTLSQLELKPPLAVASHTPLRMAIETMRSAGVGHILVCDDGRLRGIFTERDLIKRVLPSGISLDESIGCCMTADPTTIRQNDSVGWAIRTMHQGHYRHLPVVDEDGQPIGILSVKHIVHYLVEHFPSAVYNLPPEPGQVDGTREGA